MKARHWIFFAIVQATGIVLPWFANVHGNFLPFFAVFLLIPAVLIVLLLDQLSPGFLALVDDHLVLAYSVAVLVNAVTWYGVAKIAKKYPNDLLD